MCLPSNQVSQSGLLINFFYKEYFLLKIQWLFLIKYKTSEYENCLLIFWVIRKDFSNSMTKSNLYRFFCTSIEEKTQNINFIPKLWQKLSFSHDLTPYINDIINLKKKENTFSKIAKLRAAGKGAASSAITFIQKILTKKIQITAKERPKTIKSNTKA